MIDLTTMSSTRQLTQGTIDFARKKGVSGPNFKRAIDTMDSNDPRDVVYHRGLETHLKKEYGYNSPTYDKNCETLHKHDGRKSWQ